VRAFIAVPVPEATRNELVSAQSAMKRRALRSRLSPRWLPPEQLHITLKFLGYVSEEALASLAASTADEAARTPVIATSFRGFVAFPSPRRARIIAAELADPKGALATLADRVEAEAETLGVPRETRTFRPHITLARIKQPGDVSDFLAHAVPPADVALDEIVLFRSDLRPTGAIYTPLARERFLAP
jgi:2'-5' RNA ligase